MANPVPQSASPQPWGGHPTQPSSGPPATPEAGHVPAPAIDVQIRTMKSDLASLQATGGNNATPLAFALPTAPIVVPRQRRSHGFRTIVIGIVVVIVLAGLAYAGYLLYKRLVENTGPGAPAASSGTTTSATNTPSDLFPATLVEELPGAHRTLLQMAADATLVMTLNNATVSDPSQLRTYAQTLRETLNKVRTPTAEIEVRNSAGKPISFPAFLSFVNAPIIETGVYQNNFNLDFTFFVMREGNTYHAAYVMRLQDGKNWLFVKDGVAKLENARGLETLFPVIPGLRDEGGFTDGTLGKQQVRLLTYSKPDATFVYGWFRDYLILATSPATFQTIVERLQ